MSKRSKYNKFFIYAPERSGKMKGCRSLGINNRYVNAVAGLTIKDLVDFLKESRIELSDVTLPSGFMTQTRLTLCVSDVLNMKPVGKPVCLANMLDTPGVYKLRKDYLSAAIVITTNGQVHYVNDGVIDPQRWSDYSNAQVWMTKSPAPAKIAM